MSGPMAKQLAVLLTVDDWYLSADSQALLATG